MDDLVEQLAAQGSAVLKSDKLKSLAVAAERFADALATIPDYPPAELSADGFARVSAIAEQVISQIEHRLAENEIDDQTRDHLADSIYEIRRALEEAFRWRKHYLGA
jgi:glycyl-tRNA synthetase beta subunit